MSLGFHITGRIDEPDALVEKAKAIAKESGYGIAAGEEGLCIRLCPMGDLEVVWARLLPVFGSRAVQQDRNHLGQRAQAVPDRIVNRRLAP